jgi:hypothetical protein
MRDAQNLAALDAKIDEPHAQQSLQLSCVNLGKLAPAMRADWRLGIVFNAFHHAQFIILTRQIPQLQEAGWFIGHRQQHRVLFDKIPARPEDLPAPPG